MTAYPSLAKSKINNSNLGFVHIIAMIDTPYTCGAKSLIRTAIVISPNADTAVT